MLESVLGQGALHPQNVLGAPAISGNLAFEAVETIELLLRPDEVDDRHRNGTVIEIATKLEQVGLQQDILFIKGGAIAEICDAIISASIGAIENLNLNRIDAESWL